MNWFDIVALEEYEELSLVEKLIIVTLFNFIMPGGIFSFTAVITGLYW